MRTGELKVSETNSATSRNHTAFIALFRITSSEEGVVGAGYRFFKNYVKGHIGGS